MQRTTQAHATGQRVLSMVYATTGERHYFRQLPEGAAEAMARALVLQRALAALGVEGSVMIQGPDGTVYEPCRCGRLCCTLDKAQATRLTPAEAEGMADGLRATPQYRAMLDEGLTISVEPAE